MIVTEFLTARLDEDALTARVAVADDMPNRVLAEVTAKRAIMAQSADLIVSFGDWDAAEVTGIAMWPDVNRRERSQAWDRLYALASIYAGHSDYDPAWS